MPITYYVVVPFGRGEDGDLVPLEPIEAPSAESAWSRARTAAAKHGGAIAFSRAGSPATGEFGDAVILIKVGEVDEEITSASYRSVDGGEAHLSVVLWRAHLVFPSRTTPHPPMVRVLAKRLTELLADAAGDASLDNFAE